MDPTNSSYARTANKLTPVNSSNVSYVSQVPNHGELPVPVKCEAVKLEYDPFSSNIITTEAPIEYITPDNIGDTIVEIPAERLLAPAFDRTQSLSKEQISSDERMNEPTILPNKTGSVGRRGRPPKNSKSLKQQQYDPSKMPRPYNRLTPAKKLRIDELNSLGWSPRGISVNIGVSHTSVVRYITAKKTNIENRSIKLHKNPIVPLKIGYRYR